MSSRTPVNQPLPSDGFSYLMEDNPPSPMPPTPSLIDTLIEPSLFETDLLSGAALITENLQRIKELENINGTNWLRSRIADNLLFNISDMVRKCNTSLFRMKRCFSSEDRTYVNRFRFILAGINKRYRDIARADSGYTVINSWLAPSKDASVNYPYDINFGLPADDANVNYTLGKEQFDAWRKSKYGN